MMSNIKSFRSIHKITRTYPIQMHCNIYHLSNAKRFLKLYFDIQLYTFLKGKTFVGNDSNFGTSRAYTSKSYVDVE